MEKKYWQDPGILRRKKPGDVQDLFIFGYASKLFRDDKKAQEIDQGKHLIPWMGQDSLKIDRYDARGHLSDLTPYEPSSNSNYVLSPEERKFEEVLNAERYQFLNPNEQENLMYQEEELKRLKQELRSDNAYGQVQYQYQDNMPAQSTAEQQQEEEDHEPFVPSPLLDIPTNLLLPKTEKEHARIEKTASHVAAKGVQLEIIIKARQTHNPKFAFMQNSHPLHAYYTFLVAQIKSGRYKPVDKTQGEENTAANEDHYLHPSLASASVPVEAAPSIPSIPYKPSPDCAYSALVQNIKTVQQICQEPSEDMRALYASPKPYCPKGDASVYGQYEYDKSSRKSIQAAPVKVKTSSDNLYSALVQNIRSVQATEPQQRILPKKKRFSPETRKLTQVVSDVIIPPDDIKEIIFKVVSFAKSQDPAVVSKLFQSDIQKFGFLQPGHRYHKYYLHHLSHTKVVEEDIVYDPAKPTNTEILTVSDEDEPQTRSESMSPASDISDVACDKISKEATLRIPSPPPRKSFNKPSLSCKPAPVSFSIKKPKEERLEVTSALIEESSSGDEDAAHKALKAERRARLKEIEEKLARTAETKLMEQPNIKSSQEKDVKKEMDKTEESQKLNMEPSGTGVVAASVSTALVVNPNLKEKPAKYTDESVTLNGTVKPPSPSALIPSKEHKKKKKGHSSKDRHRKSNKRSPSHRRKRRFKKKAARKELKRRMSTKATIAALTSTLTAASESDRSGLQGSSQGKEMSEDLDKKREERRRRARALVEQLKEKANVPAMLKCPALEGFNLQTTGSFFGKKDIMNESLLAMEEDKDLVQAKVEKQLRQKVKNSLSKILESNVLPPILEEESTTSCEDINLLERPFVNIASPADTDDTGRLSNFEHSYSKQSSRDSSPSQDVSRVLRLRREGSEDSSSLSKFSTIQHQLSFAAQTDNCDETSFNSCSFKNKGIKRSISIDKSEEGEDEEEEEGLEIRPEQVENKWRLRTKESLTRLLARSRQHEESYHSLEKRLRKRRHSDTSNSDNYSESSRKRKKSSSRESSLSLGTEKLKFSKRNRSKERSASKERVLPSSSGFSKRNRSKERSASKERVLPSSSGFSKRNRSKERSASKERVLPSSSGSTQKPMKEHVNQNGSPKKCSRKHKKHSNDATKSKKHHHVHSSVESLADSLDSSSSSARSTASYHKKSKKKHKHRKSRKESKKSKKTHKKHRKHKRSSSITSSK